MAFCTNCGTQVLDGAAFCPNCGAPVPAAPPQNTYQQPGPQQSGYQRSADPQPEPGRYSYARQPEQEPKKKKKAGLLSVVIGILAVLFILKWFVVPIGDLVFGALDKKGTSSADEVKKLSSTIPTVNPHTPDKGIIIQWGGISAGVPYDYTAKKADDTYVMVHPEHPKKIDMMVLRYDGDYESDEEEEELEDYKEEFSKVVTVAANESEGYKLYYIVGKKEVEKKDCDAACFLILKDNELYSVDIISNLKDSQLGMAGEYLAFDPTAAFDK